MSADTVFKEAIIFIATAAAIIRFAIVEYEGVLVAWRRMTAAQKGRVVDDTETTN
jgi:hypothetical protein